MLKFRKKILLENNLYFFLFQSLKNWQLAIVVFEVWLFGLQVKSESGGRKILIFPHCVNCAKSIPHCTLVEITGFFNYSYFTWNHFWLFWRIFDAFNFYILINFKISQNLPKIKIQSLRIHQNGISDVLNSLKLISRKIWVTKKFCNFHTVA